MSSAPGPELTVSRPAGEHQLRRGALGVGFIVFFVVSAAAPLTALAGGLPVAMLLGVGPGTPAVLLMVTLILAVFAAGYTAMARYVANAGSFYAFSAVGIGRPVGGAAALIALLGYNAMQIGLYGLFGVGSAALGAQLGLELPWWLYALVGLVLVGVLGYRQVDLSAKVLAALVLAEYAAMIVLDFAIIGRGGAEGLNLQPFTAPSLMGGSLSIGLLMCFAAFMGFEASTIYSEEARNPRRTIPLATYISIAVIGLFYAFSTWAMVMGAGNDALVETIGGLPDPTVFAFTLSDQYVGPGLTIIMQILFVSSIFAALVAFHNAVSRYFYVMGREGVLHGYLGATHGRHQSPHRGSMLQSALAVVVVAIFAVTGADPVLTLFSWLTNLATLCVIALMAMTSLAVIVFFSRRKELGESTWRVQVAPFVSGILLVIILVLAVVNFRVLTGASDATAWVITATLPLAGIIGWFLTARLGRTDPHRYTSLGSNRV